MALELEAKPGQALLAKGASMNFESCPSWQGERPGMVFKKGDQGLGYYTDYPPKQYHDIFCKLKVNEMSDVLRMKSGWHERDKDGSSTLHWAALLGDVEVIKRALAEGVPVDVRAENGQTPLFWAVTKGQINAAFVLLEEGADLFAKDSLGASPPLIAVQFKQATVLLFMLARAKSRAQVLSSVDSKNCGLISWAAYVGDLAGLKILEYFKADFVNAIDDDSRTPLHRSVSQSFNKDIIEFLLDLKVDPYMKDSNGKTFLDIAGDQHGRPQVERSLKKVFEERKINPSLERTPGDTDSCKDCGDIEEGGSRQHKISASSKKAVKDFEKLMKYGPAIFWLACVSLTVFEYLIDIRTMSWTSRPVVAFLFELGIPVSVLVFVAVATMDPGIIPPRPQQHAIEELVRAFEAGSMDLAPKLCSETWVIKPPRSKYCRETGRCIEEFDHFCGWLNCAIGKNNHRPFMVLAIAEVATQLLYIFLGCCAATELVPIGDSYSNWILSLTAGYPLLVLVLFVQICTAFLIVNLVKFQGTLVCSNFTTNEFMNADRYGYMEETSLGQKRLKRSPFHKGGALANCADFWCVRTRTVGVGVD